MATPTFVKFSRIPGTPETLLTRLEQGVLHRLGFQYYQFAALKPDPDPGPWNPGLELVDDLVRCESRPQAIGMAAAWESWGVSFLSRQIPGHLDLVFFDIGADGFAATVNMESSLVHCETAEIVRGEWIRQLLLGLAVNTGALVCGFGSDNAYRIRYEMLYPDAVVERTRHGELFTMAFPNFNAISTQLMGAEEMNALLQRTPKSKFLDYRLAIGGYHILSQFP